MMYLPALGIKGNSHMLMQDRNSNQLADLVIGWIDGHVENKERRRAVTSAPSGAIMGQKVLVTAGAAGIGLAIARAFAADGAQVYVVDIDAAALAKLAQESANIQCSTCDLSDRAAIERMVPEAIAPIGRSGCAGE